MKKWLRPIGMGLGILVLVLLAAAGTLWAIGGSTFSRTYAIPEHPIPPADDSSLARGQYLAVTRGCTECHGANLGGQLLINDPAFAVLAAPNLTTGRGGAASRYTDADWERALRHGVSRDGRTLFLMPSQDFVFSDADVRALIAYIAAQPPVDSVAPPRRMGPVARILVGAGQPLPLAAAMIDHSRPHQAMREEATVAYGETVSQICRGCHGANLEGGTRAPAAPPLNSSGNLPRWTEAQFVTTLRTGVTPEGKQLDPSAMPWRALGKMNDTELKALFMYLRRE